ncbi:uncharacterized protein METZ01_LOCUS428670, partial [marine metagenome]
MPADRAPNFPRPKLLEERSEAPDRMKKIAS